MTLLLQENNKRISANRKKIGKNLKVIIFPEEKVKLN